MTDAEKALLDMVISGNFGDRECEKLRASVLKERIAPGVKERWQAAFRPYAIARRHFRREVAAMMIGDGIDLGDWRSEVESELENL